MTQTVQVTQPVTLQSQECNTDSLLQSPCAYPLCYTASHGASPVLARQAPMLVPVQLTWCLVGEIGAQH